MSRKFTGDETEPLDQGREVTVYEGQGDRPQDAEVWDAPPSALDAAVDDNQRLSTDRGVTTISPNVVEKIATRAAQEDPSVIGVEQSGIRQLIPIGGGQPEPRAEAEVQREQATVELTIRVSYPEPVRQVAERVRRRVADRVEELTGLSVAQVNITIPELIIGGGGGRQRRLE